MAPSKPSSGDNITHVSPEFAAEFTGQLEITHDPAECRAVIGEMVDALNAGPRSRERSLAVTKLQEASLWLNEAMRVE